MGEIKCFEKKFQPGYLSKNNGKFLIIMKDNTNLNSPLVIRDVTKMSKMFLVFNSDTR